MPVSRNFLVAPLPANPRNSIATVIDEPTRKKKVRSALMKLIRSKFQSDNEHSTDTTTFQVIMHFKVTPLEPSISVGQSPLH